ncbi:RDD family protein [Nostocoides jenkinsii]|uniref:RDD family protein n=1 Tax=Nostocoides jenkinsii TaxID=330834 RepID=UPI000A01FFA8|nr:RDD family protein [Tetrasphaera jenkinsii]
MTLAPQPPSLPQPPSGPPSGPPLPNVPRPATGLRIEVEYPALIGYVPASFGQRAGAVIVESVVSTCVIAAAFGLAVLMAQGGAIPAEGLALMAFVVLAYGIASLFVMLKHGASIGGLMIGLRHVSSVTGELAHGAVVGKQVIKGLVSTITLGLGNIALLILRPPSNQHWVDRAVGVVVVDIKRGRDPRRKAAAPAVARGAAPGPAPVPAQPAMDPALPGIIQAVPGGVQRPPVAAPVWPQNSPAENAWSARPAPVIKDMRSVDGQATMPPPVEDGSGTATTMRRSGMSVTVLLDNGQRIHIDGPVLLGRNPSAVMGFEQARLIPVPDEARSISKTHVALGPAGSGVWVQDLHSTNGVTVTEPGNGSRQLGAGERVTVMPGARVTYGDRSLVVGG